MSEHRFWFKRGELEFELAGDRDFVEAQLERLLARFGEAEDAPKAEQGGFRRVSEDFRPRVNITLADLIAMKQAASPVDQLVVAGYYMEKYQQRQAYPVEALAELLEPIDGWAERSVEDFVRLSVNKGYLDALRDEQYTLTYKGQNYVREGLKD